MKLPSNYSEHGEQRTIFNHFKVHPPKYKICVDVGACQVLNSNTYQLINSGWTGLLIEPNPKLIPDLTAGFPRARTTILNIAISTKQEVRKLFLHSAIGHDSLISNWYPQTKTDQTIDIPAHPLDHVLYKNRIPQDFDLLSIDTEGMDEQIIRTLFQTSHYRPTMIVTEATSYTNAGDLFGFYAYHQIADLGKAPFNNLIFLRNPP